MAIPFSWENKARLAWDELTAAARDHRHIFYGDLGASIGVIPLNVSRALGKIQDYCLDHRHPPLTVLAINRETRRPGEGFVAWDVDDVEAAEKLVWAFNWQLLPNPFAGFDEATTEVSLASRLVSRPDAAEDVYRRVKDRGVAQRIFRTALLKAYDSHCAFCGLSFPGALEGAHIVRWAKCDDQQRMDPRNGLLLCATHHKMFDAGVIAPTEELSIEYCDPHSDEYHSDADRAASMDLHGGKLRLPQRRSLWPDKALIRQRRISDGW